MDIRDIGRALVLLLVCAGVCAAAENGGGLAAFAAAKVKADAAEAPVAAVAIWERFIESNPPAADLKLARAELESWRKLAEDGAEKINGKWIGGEQRRQLIQRAEALASEATKNAKGHTLAALRQLEEAQAIYPNSYRINFMLGYAQLMASNFEPAAKYFGQCMKIRPNAPEALNNMGVVLLLQNDYARGLELIYQAASGRDRKDLAQNLYDAVEGAPADVRGRERFKTISEASNVLASKYGIRRTGGQYTLIPPPKARASGEEPPPGAVHSGTGFIIRPDGLVLTNRHVAVGGNTILVLLPGGGRRIAELVKLDAELDLALLKIRTDVKLPVVQFSPDDLPGEGAACYALGFPMADRLGTSVKITRGIVSGFERGEGADVLTDAKVNPGNSGGPLLDKHGLAMGIISQKRFDIGLEESYGLAISAGKVRQFLKKNHVEIAPGAPGVDELTAEQIVGQCKGGTVCILVVRE